MRPRLTVTSMTMTFVLMAVAASVFGGEEMLSTSAVMPAFALTAHDGSLVSSAELLGTPYLLYYYPKADTPGCTQEACALRDSWSDVEKAGLAVFGVSYDTPEDNAAFAAKYHLPFLLLSDSKKELAEQVGAARALLPVPKRISYLVGRDGRVLKAYPSVRPAEHAQEVLADFRQLDGSR